MRNCYLPPLFLTSVSKEAHSNAGGIRSYPRSPHQFDSLALLLKEVIGVRAFAK